MMEEMTCPYHPDRPVVGFCSKCRRPVCRTCGIRVLDRELDYLSSIKIRGLLESRGLVKPVYICTECNKLKSSLSARNFLYLGSGIAAFLIGLFIEFLPLVVIGAIILISAIYSLIPR